jgi:excisionase family DNA binding protein
MELIRLSQAAKLLGIERSTLDKWQRKGLLQPVVKTLGGHRRFDPMEIIKLAEAMRAKAFADVTEEMKEVTNESNSDKSTL